LTVFHKTINQAIQDVQARFPFPEIFEDTVDTIKSLCDVLREFVPDGGRLLDIGCGALDKPLVFQEIGYQCFGCDTFEDPWHAQPENLEPVLDFARERGVEVYDQGASYELPWKPGSFDVATIVNVIEHLHVSPREILNFAGVYLKPGGLLIVAMPNSVNLRKRLDVARGRSNYTPVKGFYDFIGFWPGHVREFTLGETAQIVQWTGFEIVGTKMFHGMLKSRLHNPALQVLFKVICSVRSSYKDSLLVVAKKPDSWFPREPDQRDMEASYGVPQYSRQ
jgi:SAM-dependent methyltransferase